MLEITYLGHSGWVIEAGDSAIAIDPLLFSDFGRGPSGARLPLWPPRRFSFEYFPPLEAVVISHEHEDHLDLPSLNLIDRRVPIFLAGRASEAGRTAVTELGFSVRPNYPGRTKRFGRLEIAAFSPDHMLSDNCDEWDASSLAVRDLIGGGCFFTIVDVNPTQDMIARLRSFLGPAESVLVFRGDRFWWAPVSQLGKILERKTWQVSAIDSEDPSGELSDGKVVKVSPAYRCRIDAKNVRPIGRESSFISILPKNQWPPRPAWSCHGGPNYGPACGRFELTDADSDELLDGLQDLAGWLYGTSLYRKLYSFPVPEDGPTPTLLFVLLASQGRDCYTLEYNPASCSFRPASTLEPTKEYMCGIECWATDLLAVFRGEFEPRILSAGHARSWLLDSTLPDLFASVVWPFFHPQRRPGQCLNGFRAQIARINEAKRDVVIHGKISNSLQRAQLQSG